MGELFYKNCTIFNDHPIELHNSRIQGQLNDTKPAEGAIAAAAILSGVKSEYLKKIRTDNTLALSSSSKNQGEIRRVASKY